MLQPPQTQSRYGIAAVCSVFIVLLVMTVCAFTFLQAEQSGRMAATMMNQRKLDLLNLLQTLTDAETGQRGYLLTGNSQYLQPYDAAIGKIAGGIGPIDRLAGTDGAERASFDRLSAAVGKKMTELSTTIALFQAGDHANALEIVRTNYGKATMDDIRASISDIIHRENGKIAALNIRLERDAVLVRIMIVATSVFLFATAGIIVWYLLRVLNETIKAAQAIKQANDEIILQTAQREQAEGQLRQMQKMESLGQLAGGLAHDLNNMLSVIIGSLSLFKRRHERGEDGLLRYVDAAEEAAGNAATLTQRMLAFSRRQALAPTHIDVNRFVSGVSELLRHALGGRIQLETVLAGGLWAAFADANQLENALLNLAINARDAMPAGGRLTIETSNAHLDEAYTLANADSFAGQYVLIAVTDSGTGMSAETMARAFEPFFTTKASGQGTGLGLSQVYGFVKQSQGHIKIYSELGAGTTIKLYLPRSHDGDHRQPAAAGASELPMPMGNPKTVILVVDDDSAVRDVTADTLRELGYAVLEAASGAAGLALLDRHPDIALLLTDVMMPGMSGRQLAEEACRRRPGLIVLYASGYTRNAIVHNGIIDPGVNLLAKPFTIRELARKLKDLLDTRATS